MCALVCVCVMCVVCVSEMCVPVCGVCVRVERCEMCVHVCVHVDVACVRKSGEVHVCTGVVSVYVCICMCNPCTTTLLFSFLTSRA